MFYCGVFICIMFCLAVVMAILYQSLLWRQGTSEQYTQYIILSIDGSGSLVTKAIFTGREPESHYYGNPYLSPHAVITSTTNTQTLHTGTYNTCSFLGLIFKGAVTSNYVVNEVYVI